jgi:hypothetical protein
MNLFNQIEEIDESQGRYLLLTDYRTEGLSITGQYGTAEEAIVAFGSDFPQVIVYLPSFAFEVDIGA